MRFRAWDKVRGVMLSNHTFKTIGKLGLYNDEDLIWMLSYGKKDVRGTEIYEGDIFEYIDSNGDYVGERFEIVFENGAFGFYNMSFFDTDIDVSNILIVSNIYKT